MDHLPQIVAVLPASKAASVNTFVVIVTHILHVWGNDKTHTDDEHVQTIAPSIVAVYVGLQYR